MRTVVSLLALSLLVSGCVGPLAPAGIYARTPSELEQENTADVARAYGLQRGGWPGEPARFESELRRRRAFTDDQWARIERREVRPGDTGEFVLAAWGPPGDSLTRRAADGSFAVWHYHHDTTRPGAVGYVVFSGNLVTSIDQ